MAKVSVIVATFKNVNQLSNCLRSIFTGNHQDLEVVVVDNGADGVDSLISENYVSVRLVKNNKNFGSSRARNQGIEISKGEWVLVLDSDVVLSEDFIQKGLSRLEKMHSEVGIVQPKILNSDGSKIYSCGIHMSYLMRFYDIGKGKAGSAVFNKERHVFGACSAAVFYRRKMLEDTKESGGYFDERFFFLVEDVDLSWRAQRKGWKALFIPDLVCFHAGNSSNTPRQLRQYFCFRNRFFSIIKNEKSFLRVFISFVIYDIPRTFYLFFVNRFTLKALKEALAFKRASRV